MGNVKQKFFKKNFLAPKFKFSENNLNFAPKKFKISAKNFEI
jgi:hypothetical protein